MTDDDETANNAPVRAREVLDLLAKIEWSDWENGNPRCPSCKGYAILGTGHRAGCIIPRLRKRIDALPFQ